MHRSTFALMVTRIHWLITPVCLVLPVDWHYCIFIVAGLSTCRAVKWGQLDSLHSDQSFNYQWNRMWSLQLTIARNLHRCCSFGAQLVYCWFALLCKVCIGVTLLWCECDVQQCCYTTAVNDTGVHVVYSFICCWYYQIFIVTVNPTCTPSEFYHLIGNVVSIFWSLS